MSGESLSLQRAPIRARPNCSMLAEEQCSLDGDEMDSQVPQWQSRGSGGRWDANLKGRRVGPRRDRKRSEARSIGSLQSPIHVGLQRPRASTRGRSSIAGRCGEQWREDPIAHERRRNSTQAKMAAIPQTRFLQPPEAMAPSQRQDGRKHHRASSASIAPSCRRRTSTRRVCSRAYFLTRIVSWPPVRCKATIYLSFVETVMRLDSSGDHLVGRPCNHTFGLCRWQDAAPGVMPDDVSFRH
jgi:hypothetical protein